MTSLTIACLQNVAEAEYVVLAFQFMRLRGYPKEKITILTTYNGQKALIRDVIEQRCAAHPSFGRPHTVSSLLFKLLIALLAAG